MDDFCKRTLSLIGEDKLNKLKSSKILLFGLGGVGGYALEGLVRAGILNFVLIDDDIISVSNINRQILALNSTVGIKKTVAAKERILDINPDCKVIIHDIFVSKENIDEIDFSDADYVIDAIDTVSSKIEIVKKAQSENIPVISSMGTGNKLHPELLEIADIYKTSDCPLARTMRKLCKDNNIKKLKTVYSKEINNNICCETENGRHIPSSISYTPAVAGLLITSAVVNDIISD